MVKTRTNQTKDLSLFSRGKKAKGCDLFLSLHSNAVGSGVKESVDYPVAYVLRPNANTDIDDKSAAIGLRLAKAVQAIMNTTQAARTATRASNNDRDGNGVKDDEYYGVLEAARQVKVPAVILEHSFHTATKPTQWMLSGANLKKLAQREAECIAEWLNVPAAPKPAEKDDLYRVRVTIDDLKICSGPGTKYASKGYIMPGVYRITAEDGIWLKLCSGAGWISSKYAKKI